MIYFLTPTGARHEGMALLAEYVNAQTYTGPAHWLLVDDCDPATRTPQVRAGIEVEIIRPDWRWQRGMNTQSQSLAAGLARIPEGATVIVLEDDDLYLPPHIENMLAALETADLVGEQTSLYYNVVTQRCRPMPGKYHASLAATACKGDATELLRQVCERGSRRIDMDVWREYEGAKRLLSTTNVVGIKGLPGRAGIGVGHRNGFGTPDPGGQQLIDWVGPELAANYDIFREAR